MDNTHGRAKVNQCFSAWTGLAKGIKRDKTLLNMVIRVGSPSEAWKNILSMVGESSKAAYDKIN